MNIHELYGRLAEERQAERDAHFRTLAVLKGIVAGEIDIGRVEMTDGGAGWRVLPVKADSEQGGEG